MQEIAGARQELDRAREWLREELLRVAEAALPGSPVQVTEPGVLSAVADTGRYRRSAQLVVDRPGPWDPDAAARVAQTLRSAGWQTTGPHPDERGQLEVVARRDGHEVQVRAFEQAPTIGQAMDAYNAVMPRAFATWRVEVKSAVALSEGDPF